MNKGPLLCLWISEEKFSFLDVLNLLLHENIVEDVVSRKILVNEEDVDVMTNNFLRFYSLFCRADLAKLKKVCSLEGFKQIETVFKHVRLSGGKCEQMFNKIVVWPRKNCEYLTFHFQVFSFA